MTDEDDDDDDRVTAGEKKDNVTFFVLGRSVGIDRVVA